MSTMKMFIHSSSVKTLLLSFGLLVAGWQHGSAQSQNVITEPQSVSSDDQTIVSAIAPYRDDVRRSILLASEQPAILTGLAQQRASSQQAFTALIQSYPQNKQGWFYDISRYPDVLHELAVLPKGSNESAVKNMTKNMPADLQETAWKLYRHHHDDLVQADNLNQQAQQSFDSLVSPLDVPTQNAFRQLIDMPDVLTQLTDQLDKTTQLGQAYQANPDMITKELTALHDSLTVQNQHELADYQNELNSDPQAKQELQQAGQAYAQANGYNSGINPNPAWVNSSYYYQNPYPYFFGYPYWYTSAMWYPSAWWYGTGFYYGLGGNMVLFGMPSMGFSNWFFGPGRGAYPHLYNRFNNYYSRAIGEHRIMTSGNAGFMTSARQAFGPATGASRGNWLTNSRQYNRPNNWSNANANITRSAPASRYQNFNAGGYHTQSWGGGGMRSFGGGFGGGGFHGGGGRR